MSRKAPKWSFNRNAFCRSAVVSPMTVKKQQPKATSMRGGGAGLAVHSHMPMKTVKV